MDFNFIDILIFFFFIYFLWQGYQTGFLGGILNIISTIVSFAAAIYFYPDLAGVFSSSLKWGEHVSAVASFFIILILVEVITSFILHHAYSLLAPIYKRIEGIATLDKILGFIPSVLVGLFLVSLFLILPLILPVNENIRQPIADSFWGKTVLKKGLSYQAQIEGLLSRLPYKNLAYLITPQPLSRQSVDLDFPKEIKLVPDPASEKAMFDLVNHERQKVGLKTLIWKEEILKVARAHCLDMFSRGYFSHYSPEGKSPFDRMDDSGIKYKSAGENLAYAPNAQLAHDGLMNSPGHRANILREQFGHMAIGAIDGGIHGKMFCQEFTD